jgi:hypothetical protein
MLISGGGASSSNQDSGSLSRTDQSGAASSYTFSPAAGASGTPQTFLGVQRDALGRSTADYVNKSTNSGVSNADGGRRLF